MPMIYANTGGGGGGGGVGGGVGGGGGLEGLGRGGEGGGGRVVEAQTSANKTDIRGGGEDSDSSVNRIRNKHRRRNWDILTIMAKRRLRAP